jgi:hypothetical protein
LQLWLEEVRRDLTGRRLAVGEIPIRSAAVSAFFFFFFFFFFESSPKLSRRPPWLWRSLREFPSGLWK